MSTKAEKPHVLVVDDNPETCTLLTALLHREFAVEVASDGMEAIERLRTNRYGAILLDLRMPQYDGFTVLDHLKESQPEQLQSVIVVTAVVHERELKRARAYNVCDVVLKPFDVETLLASVKKCVAPEEHGIGGVFCGPVIILLANLLRQRLM